MINYRDILIRSISIFLYKIYNVVLKVSVTLWQISINDHIKKIFEDSELQEDSVIRKFRITALDGCKGLYHQRLGYGWWAAESYGYMDVTIIEKKLSWSENPCKHEWSIIMIGIGWYKKSKNDKKIFQYMKEQD